MLFTNLLATFLLALSCTALPSPYESDLERRVTCKSPLCTSYCPDGTPYDCCVVYIRDPCADHQVVKKCTGPDCICDCPNGHGTYLCNVQYVRDPCATLSKTAA